MAIRYHITLKDPEKARGNDYLFSFIAHGADEFAEELEDVLRSDEFFERWRGYAALGYDIVRHDLVLKESAG